MALKYKYQVEEVPSGATAPQIETFLNNAGQSGWRVIQFLTVGTKMFVVAIKELSQ